MNTKSCAAILILALASVLFIYGLIVNRQIARFNAYLPGGYDLRSGEYGVMITFRPTKLELDKMEKDHIRFPSIIYIGPHVGGYRVLPGLIVGKISPRFSDSEFSGLIGNSLHYERRKGYFIIDNHTQKVYGGLKRQEWIVMLRKYGITREPMLYVPSWRDEKLGRNKPQANDAQ